MTTTNCLSRRKRIRPLSDEDSDSDSSSRGELQCRQTPPHPPKLPRRDPLHRQLSSSSSESECELDLDESDSEAQSESQTRHETSNHPVIDLDCDSSDDSVATAELVRRLDGARTASSKKATTVVVPKEGSTPLRLGIREIRSASRVEANHETGSLSIQSEGEDDGFPAQGDSSVDTVELTRRLDANLKGKCGSSPRDRHPRDNSLETPFPVAAENKADFRDDGYDPTDDSSVDAARLTRPLHANLQETHDASLLDRTRNSGAALLSSPPGTAEDDRHRFRDDSTFEEGDDCSVDTAELTKRLDANLGHKRSTSPQERTPQNSSLAIPSLPGAAEDTVEFQVHNFPHTPPGSFFVDGAGQDRRRDTNLEATPEKKTCTAQSYSPPAAPDDDGGLTWDESTAELDDESSVDTAELTRRLDANLRTPDTRQQLSPVEASPPEKDAGGGHTTTSAMVPTTGEQQLPLVEFRLPPQSDSSDSCPSSPESLSSTHQEASQQTRKVPHYKSSREPPRIPTAQKDSPRCHPMPENPQHEAKRPPTVNLYVNRETRAVTKAGMPGQPSCSPPRTSGFQTEDPALNQKPEPKPAHVRTQSPTAAMARDLKQPPASANLSTKQSSRRQSPPRAAFVSPGARQSLVKATPMQGRGDNDEGYRNSFNTPTVCNVHTKFSNTAPTDKNLYAAAFDSQQGSSMKQPGQDTTCPQVQHVESSEDLYTKAFDEEMPGQANHNRHVELVDLVDSDCECDSQAMPNTRTFVRNGLRSPVKSPRFNIAARAFPKRDVRNDDKQASDIDESPCPSDGEFNDETYRPPRQAARRVTNDHTLNIQRLHRQQGRFLPQQESAAHAPLTTGQHGALPRPWTRTRPRLRDAVSSNPFFAASVVPKRKPAKQQGVSAEPIPLQQAGIGLWFQRPAATEQRSQRSIPSVQRNDIRGGSGVGSGGVMLMGRNQAEDESDPVEEPEPEEIAPRSKRPTKKAKGKRGRGGKKNYANKKRKGSNGNRRRKGGRASAGGRGRGGSAWGETSNDNGWSASVEHAREDPELRNIGGTEISF